MSSFLVPFPNNPPFKARLLFYYFLLMWTASTRSQDVNTVTNADDEATTVLPNLSDGTVMETEASFHAKDSWMKVLEDDNANLVSVDRPEKLVVVAATSSSITIKWEFQSTKSSSGFESSIDGFRIFFSFQNTNQSRTVGSSERTFELQGLAPFTTYQIWVEGYIGIWRTLASHAIFANTDVDQPGRPVLLNATCFDTGQIYVKWQRPERFDNSVDIYKLFHKPVAESTFKTANIQASAQDETISFVITNLTVDTEYVVKVCAGSKSLSNQNKTLLGEPSNEIIVYLPSENCDAGMVASRSSDDFSTGIIAGVVCAILIILIIIIVVCIFRRRHQKHPDFEVEKIQATPLPTPEHFNNVEEKFGPDWSRQAIPVSKFAEHVAELHMDSDLGFSREYEEIQKFAKDHVKASSEHSTKSDNIKKNRYMNIVAYDHSRVKLLPLPGHGGQQSSKKNSSDYINANFIDSFRSANSYIGTQGPLESTFEAFWRMTWHQNVHVIVMITNLMERTRRKCDRYWPKEGTETYGHFEATLLKEEVMANFTRRFIRLKHTKLKGSPNQRDIQQFHYTSWPDHGVPSHPLPVLSYIRKSVAANPADGGPIIVHCSAGVGRTGTYIAIDSMLQQVNLKKELNVYGFLKHIRGQRNYLVQTEEQYVFIHDALLEAILSGNTEVHLNQLTEHIEKLNQIEADGDADGHQATLLERQFKLATSFSPRNILKHASQQKYNQGKCRDPSLVPVEGSRVCLAAKPGVEGSDFINATWLHGHNKLREFIITQHPNNDNNTSGGIEDFWRMLWDKTAQTVVVLSSEEEAFWPTKDGETELHFESFRVRFVDESIHSGYSCFDCAVTSNDDDFGLAIRIIYSPGWPSAAHQSSANLVDVFSLLKVVQDWHLEYQNGPLVVVDKFGGTEAASFCALTTLCKELASFDSVDVYQVAKLYHEKRPGIWKSSDDLLFLYQSMSALVSSRRDNPASGTPVSNATLPKSSTSNISPNSNGGMTIVSDLPWTRKSGNQKHNLSRIKKSVSGHGLSSIATSTTTNTTDDEGPTSASTTSRRYSFPTSFRSETSSASSGCVGGCTGDPLTHGFTISIPNDDEELTEMAAQKSPLLKTNSNDV